MFQRKMMTDKKKLDKETMDVDDYDYTDDPPLQIGNIRFQ